jgi:hypothetical protein
VRVNQIIDTWLNLNVLNLNVTVPQDWTGHSSLFVPSFCVSTNSMVSSVALELFTMLLAISINSCCTTPNTVSIFLAPLQLDTYNVRASSTLFLYDSCACLILIAHSCNNCADVIRFVSEYVLTLPYNVLTLGMSLHLASKQSPGGWYQHSSSPFPLSFLRPVIK